MLRSLGEHIAAALIRLSKEKSRRHAADHDGDDEESAALLLLDVPTGHSPYPYDDDLSTFNARSLHTASPSSLSHYPSLLRYLSPKCMSVVSYMTAAALGTVLGMLCAVVITTHYTSVPTFSLLSSLSFSYLSSTSDFSPVPAPSSCLCSSMYRWSDLPQYPFVNWQLNPSSTYREWDECGMSTPRSSLVYGATPIPGPDNTWQLPSCLAFDVWVPTVPPSSSTAGLVAGSASSAFRPLSPASSSPIYTTRASASHAFRHQSAPSASSSTPLYRAPVFSVQVTVFDQEAKIVEYVHAAIALASEPFELVVVFDDCTDSSIAFTHALLTQILDDCTRAFSDDTLESLQPAYSSWPREALHGHYRHDTANLTTASLPTASPSSADRCLNRDLVHVRTIVQPTGVWETAANNIGVRATHPSVDYVVLLQDDILVQQPGYTSLMAAPLRLWPADVFGVTARCAHRMYSSGQYPEHHNITWANNGASGRCWGEVEHELHTSDESRCVFGIRDSGNRGPILLSHKRMRRLGYFDEQHYLLQDSDHDLFARAYLHQRWTVGYLPVEYVMQAEYGGTRKKNKPKRSPAADRYLEARMVRMRMTAAEGLTGLDQAVLEGRKWLPHDEDRRMPGRLWQLCLQQVQSGSAHNETSDSVWWSKTNVHLAVQELT